MNEPASISIVIAAYNVEHFLAATLDSVLAQTITDWECIVVDDGSRDSTAAIANRYVSRDTRFRLVQQENLGVSAARNRGIAQANLTAPYITFMDSDDVWKDNALEVLRTELEKHPEAVGAHGLADWIDASGCLFQPGEYASSLRNRGHFDGKKIVDLPTEAPTTFRVLVLECPIVPPGLLLARRIFIDKAGPFEVLRLVEDYDMWIRLSRFGDIRFVDQVILGYRRHNHNLTNRPQLSQKNYLRYRTFFSEENNEEQKSIVRGAYRAWQASRARKNVSEAWHALICGNLRGYARAMKWLALHCVGYLRGYPTPYDKEP
jgi:glycosyltransferase involved in cell wall biosynthesis